MREQHLHLFVHIISTQEIWCDITSRYVWVKILCFIWHCLYNIDQSLSNWLLALEGRGWSSSLYYMCLSYHHDYIIEYIGVFFNTIAAENMGHDSGFLDFAYKKWSLSYPSKKDYLYEKKKRNKKIKASIHSKDPYSLKHKEKVKSSPHLIISFHTVPFLLLSFSWT